MKVVLFCGGFGVRMGEATKTTPKPMIPIGDQPIVRHIMRYYASFGHTDFIVCVGYRGDVVVDYFTFSAASSRSRRRKRNGDDLSVVVHDDVDWHVTFVDTGESANIGQRLLGASHHLETEDMFLATYGDGLTDIPLDTMIDQMRASGKTAMFASVRPSLSYHVVSADEDGAVTSIEEIDSGDVRINGGFFVFRREMLGFIEPGEELVHEPFHRLIERRELIAYRHDGFFGPMDTMKDKQRLDTLWDSGEAPWQRERASGRRLASA